MWISRTRFCWKLSTMSSSQKQWLRWRSMVQPLSTPLWKTGLAIAAFSFIRAAVISLMTRIYNKRLCNSTMIYLLWIILVIWRPSNLSSIATGGQGCLFSLEIMSLVVPSTSKWRSTPICPPLVLFPSAQTPASSLSPRSLATSSQTFHWAPVLIVWWLWSTTHLC